MSLRAVILAAGKSTRMKSKLPKALHEIAGRPMLRYVLQAAYDAGCEKTIVVVGWGKEQIMAEFDDDPRITWVEQAEQHGTGHAVRVCESELRKGSGNVLILAGDGPLVRGQVLSALVSAHRQEHAAASMATAILDDPTGYGRIVRDELGNFLRIVEHIDCTERQREIREVFPSYYCVRGEELLTALAMLRNDNKKGEYYLTDIYRHLRDAGRKVVAVQAVAAEDVIGVNDRHQLAEVDAIMQERIQRRLRDGGVTIVSGVNTYVEDGVTIGADTVIQPFSFIGRDSTIGADCMIGSFARLPRQSIIADGTTMTGGISTGVETTVVITGQS